MSLATAHGVGQSKPGLFERLAERPELNSSDRLVALTIDSATAYGKDCCRSNATLARLTGLSEPTIRRAVARLEHAGILRRIRLYCLKARRALVLLWREYVSRATEKAAEREALRAAKREQSCRSTVSASSELTINGDRQWRSTVSARSAVPPDPPIEGSEDSGCIENLKGGSALRACEPPGGVAGEDAKLVAKTLNAATDVFGDEPGIESWLRALAKQFGGHWDWVCHLLRNRNWDSVANRQGYLFRAMQGLQEQGGIPEDEIEEEREVHRATEEDIRTAAMVRYEGVTKEQWQASLARNPDLDPRKLILEAFRSLGPDCPAELIAQAELMVAGGAS